MGDSKPKWVGVTMSDGTKFKMPCVGNFQEAASAFIRENPGMFEIKIDSYGKVSVTQVEKTETKGNTCRFGTKCNNSECTSPHPAGWTRPPPQICKNFASGTCKFGDKCKFRHQDTDAAGAAGF